MARWELIGAVDEQSLATRVYRGDLYRAAMAPLGISVPLVDCKSEGAHRAPWQLEASPGAIAMEPDSFCDGAVFEAVAASVNI
jgi:hypothetical protein